MVYVALLHIPTEILMKKIMTQLEAQPMQCKQKRTMYLFSIYLQPKSQVKLRSFVGPLRIQIDIINFK